MLRGRHKIVLALAAACACSTPANTDNASSQSGSTLDGRPNNASTSTSEGSTNPESDADADSAALECEVDEDCGATLPYCDAGACVDCTLIGHTGCVARDPQRAICETESGLCVQCTPDLQEACDVYHPNCSKEGDCLGCVDASECVAFCDPGSGQCDAIDLSIKVYRWDLTQEPGLDVDVVSVTTDQFSASAGTDGLGEVFFGTVPVPDEMTTYVRLKQNEPISVLTNATIIRQAPRMPTSSAQVLRLPYITNYNAGRLAYECGLIETLDEATGVLTEFIHEAFHYRATLFVELVGSDGGSTEAIDRNDLQIELDGFPLVHTMSDPAQIIDVFACDIGSLGNLRIGQPDSELVGSARWFVIFGIRDFGESPIGSGTVTAPGFELAEFRTQSYGNMAFTTLRKSP